MEHTQFSDNYRAAYLSVANMVLQTHGWIRVVTPTWDATVEAHQNEINRLKATIQRGVKLLTKLLHG